MASRQWRVPLEFFPGNVLVNAGCMTLCPINITPFEVGANAIRGFHGGTNTPTPFADIIGTGNRSYVVLEFTGWPDLPYCVSDVSLRVDFDQVNSDLSQVERVRMGYVRITDIRQPPLVSINPYDPDQDAATPIEEYVNSVGGTMPPTRTVDFPGGLNGVFDRDAPGITVNSVHVVVSALPGNYRIRILNAELKGNIIA